jgi:hypothetical protein
MKPCLKFLRNNVSTAQALGVLGSSALIALGTLQSAQAATIKAGTDLLFTPRGGAFYGLTVNGQVVGTSFAGLPIDPALYGKTDTIVDRTASLTLNLGETGTTPIIVQNLSLKSINSVAGFDVYAGLTPGTSSTGSMDITLTSSTGGTWDSVFDLHATAVLVPQGSVNPTGQTDLVNFLISQCGSTYQCISFNKTFTATGEGWSTTPPSGTFVDPSDPDKNFYLTGLALHDAGDGVIHRVRPPGVPEPSTMLGSVLFLGAGGLMKKKFGKKSKEKLQAPAA